jgi:1-acyl-sn-glycerol-3-phosphate acyltransferase
MQKRRSCTVKAFFSKQIMAIFRLVKIIIQTLIFYFFGFIVSLFFLLLILPFSLLTAKNRYDNRVCFFLVYVWNLTIVRLSFIQYSIEGVENIPNYPDQPSIIISNHCSFFDIPFIEICLKKFPHIWVCKASLTRIPFFGFVLRRLTVLVSGNRNKKSIKTLRATYLLLKNKSRHVIIFPEGRRYNDDGKVHDFYGGFSVLSEMLDRPIIPIVIYGLHKICPKNSLLIDSSKCNVKIKVGKPIFFDKTISKKKFSALVHTWFNKEINKMSTVVR